MIFPSAKSKSGKIEMKMWSSQSEEFEEFEDRKDFESVESPGRREAGEIIVTCHCWVSQVSIDLLLFRWILEIIMEI